MYTLYNKGKLKFLKSPFDSLAGTSFRDGNIYISSIPKSSVEAIAVLTDDNYSFALKRAEPHVGGKVTHRLTSHCLETYPLYEVSAGMTSGNATYATTAASTRFDIFAEYGHEIFLNIIPQSPSSKVTDNASPNESHVRKININVGFPRKGKRRIVKVAVNKKGGFKRHRSKGASLLCFFKRRRKSGQDYAMRTPMQQMINSNLVRPSSELGQNRLSGKCLKEIEETRSIGSFSQENELDAYMREIRLRTE